MAVDLITSYPKIKRVAKELGTSTEGQQEEEAMAGGDSDWDLGITLRIAEFNAVKMKRLRLEGSWYDCSPVFSHICFADTSGVIIGHTRGTLVTLPLGTTFYNDLLIEKYVSTIVVVVIVIVSDQLFNSILEELLKIGRTMRNQHVSNFPRNFLGTAHFVCTTRRSRKVCLNRRSLNPL